MLVAAGSFVEQGEMKLWQVIAVASAAAILGDQIAYGLSRWGGRRVIKRLSRKIGVEENIKQAEALTKRWGGTGIFFSRWLITALGPWVNVASGIAIYPGGASCFGMFSGEVSLGGPVCRIGYVF